MAIRLGCHLWTFASCTVAEAAAITRALGLDYLDLGNGPDLDPLVVAAHPDREAARLNRVREETGITFVDCFPQVGEDGLSFPNNHPDPAVRERHRAVWRGFFSFAAQVGLQGITLSPGRYWPDSTPGEDFERAAEQLRWAVAEGAARGLRVRIEPHVESVTWRPELAVAMVEAVPGLSLTVDHSHFVFHALPYEQIAVLHPHGTHWHARQARPGAVQAGRQGGTIDFGRIMDDLQAAGYDGVVCLEYTTGTWMSPASVECLSETVALRDELRGYLAG